MSDTPHEISSEWALAAALQRMTKEIRPAVRAAYKAESYEERVKLAKEALPRCRELVAVVAFAANEDIEP